MKSQKDRVADATAEYQRALRENPESTVAELVSAILDAADREPPRWPTDGSVSAFGAVLAKHKATTALSPHQSREILRAAMLADPIIRAAVALAEDYTPKPDCLRESIAAVVDAVREAGL